MKCGTGLKFGGSRPHRKSLHHSCRRCCRQRWAKHKRLGSTPQLISGNSATIAHGSWQHACCKRYMTHRVDDDHVELMLLGVVPRCTLGKHLHRSYTTLLLSRLLVHLKSRVIRHTMKDSPPEHRVLLAQ